MTLRKDWDDSLQGTDQELLAERQRIREHDIEARQLRPYLEENYIMIVSYIRNEDGSANATNYEGDYFYFPPDAMLDLTFTEACNDILFMRYLEEHMDQARPAGGFIYGTEWIGNVL